MARAGALVGDSPGPASGPARVPVWPAWRAMWRHYGRPASTLTSEPQSYRELQRDSAESMTTAKRRATTSSPAPDTVPDTATSQASSERRASPLSQNAAGARRDGKVEVAAQAIATIAAQAATECYGVAGIASRHPRLGAMQRLAPTDYARGVEVRFVDDHVVIDLWLILEHSLRVVEVAHNVMVIVKYAVEQALGLHVVEVNINVQALRVRE